MTIKLLSIVGATIFLNVFCIKSTNFNQDEDVKIITFSCGNNQCIDEDTRCAFNEPAYMLNGICVKDDIVIDSLTEGAIKAISCNCGGCGMHLYGSDNIDDLDPYISIVSKYWIDDSVWEQLAKKVLLKTGNATFNVIKIESIIIKEKFTALNFTYLSHEGKDEVAIVDINIPL